MEAKNERVQYLRFAERFNLASRQGKGDSMRAGARARGGGGRSAADMFVLR